MTDAGFALFNNSTQLQASNPKFLGLSSQLQDMVRCGVLRSDHVSAWEGSHPIPNNVFVPFYLLG